MSNNQLSAVHKLPGRRKGDPTRRVLGQAESTQATHTAALKWANHIFQQLGMKKQFEDLKACDVENENMEELYHDLIAFAANNPYTHQNPEKEKEGKVKACSFGTISNYAGIIKNLLREKFPDHPSWPQSPADNPLWFKTTTGDNFKKEFERSSKMWSEEDYYLGSNKITALYKYGLGLFHHNDPDDLHAAAAWYGQDLVGEGEYPTSQMGRDFNTICINLFAAVTPLKPESYRGITRNVYTAGFCMRAVEAKYLSWNTVKYEPRVHVMTVEKPQAKTLVNTTVCGAMNTKNPLVCTQYGTGLLIFAGKGLTRTHEQRESNANSRIFPEEFFLSASQVARRATASLRAGLPRSMSQEGRESVSAKSLRMGFITEVSIHPYSNNEDVIAMSGHKNGNNSDNYKDLHTCNRSYRAAKIWAEHESMDRTVVPPQCHWVGHAEKNKPMWDKLYLAAIGACVVDAFLPGGRLHGFGLILLSQQVMWHNHLLDKFGENNGHIIYMQDLFKLCDIRDAEEPDLAPKLVLEKWSNILFEEFQRQNNHAYNQDFSAYTMQQLVRAVEGNVKQLASIDRQMHRVLKEEPMRNEQIAALLRYHQSNLSRIDKVMSENKNLLTKLLEEAKDKSSSDRKRKAREAAGYGGSASSSSSCAASSSPYSTPPSKCNSMESPPSVEVISPSQLQQEILTQPKRARSGSPVFNTTNNYTVNSSNVHFSGTGTGQRLEQSNFAPLPSFAMGKAAAATTRRHREAVDILMKARQEQQPVKEGLGGTVLLQEHLARQHRNNVFASGRPFCRPREPVPVYCLNDQAKHHYAMEACDMFLSEASKKILENPVQLRLHDAYMQMEQEVLDGMTLLEGGDPEVERELARKVPGKKKKASVSAIGRWAKDHKTLVRQHVPNLPKLTRGRYDDTPLIPRSEWITAGTPPGNTPILSFYGNRESQRAQPKEPQQLQLESPTASEFDASPEEIHAVFSRGADHQGEIVDLDSPEKCDNVI